ncbi:fad binding domain-containing [Trichoderma arundinaceum]|uniref:Fad binding domain-containing n=1 Tax=Trichoderma arundinaceum TaxID=490622 RepID=A0A395NTC6_TRIAR|nr:fad binding domain-containing [Trichoderma arundinaceum]
METAAASKVDVLIIGAGPAGLMLSLWMAKLGIKTRVVDKRTGKVVSGQADGFQCRTLEIFDSFGIGQKVWQEANHMLEVSFWNPGEDGKIRRHHRGPNTQPNLSRFTESVLHQGRVEGFLIDTIRASASPKHPLIEIERSVMPTSLHIDESCVDDEDAYPVEVTLRHLTEEEATPTQRLSNLQDGLYRSNLAEDDTERLLASTVGLGEEKVRAKYVVGCDGAHSWVRKTLGEGFEMKGESTDAICAEFGAMMIIPRENKLVRVYTQLREVSAGTGRVDRSQITPDLILQTARKILSPYTLDYHYIDWWTAYQIGQRVGDRFSKLNRVFLAGDAVHTHSPKAGQGMNVSMGDTYNLGWKLGLVCKKLLRPEVLDTYELERRQIARQLIAFDHKFSRLFSGRPAKDVSDEAGSSMSEFQEAFREAQLFITGVGIRYPPSLLVARASDDHDPRGLQEAETAIQSRATSAAGLASHCQLGTRFASQKVMAQSDARPWELQLQMPSDGRFRVVVFGGDISQATQLATVNRLGSWLQVNVLAPAKSPRINLAPGPDPRGGSGTSQWMMDEDPSIVDVLLVHSAPREKIELLRDLHDVFHPSDKKLGWDYGKVFADGEAHHEGHGRAYERYGVDPDRGAIVAVRPDGYIGLITALEGEDGWTQLRMWFDGLLRPSPNEAMTA